MKQINFLLTTVSLAFLALLAGCNSEPENIVAGDNDPDANKLATLPPVELPPMMTASRTYRCKDNSLVYIDFYNNNTATYKAQKAATGGTALTSEGEGKPYTAEGFSISSSGTDITLTAPGKGTTSCKA